jgi:hypothetical protein
VIFISFSFILYINLWGHDIQISLLAGGDPFERQRYLSIHRQQEGLRNKNNCQGRAFAGSHLEAGQYMDQSRLDLHQSEPLPCEQNQ